MEMPEYLFHYTSAEGVKGILESKSVWASLLHFMNDSREWQYALDLMRAELMDRLTTNPGPYWPRFVTGLSESLNQIEQLNICVFSLSAVSNQLSQWRAYCPPEGGYQLRFNSSLLRHHIHRCHFQMKECCYDVESQKKLLGQIADFVLKQVGVLSDEGTARAAVQTVQNLLFVRLANNAPILKHPDFNEEKEWRAFGPVACDDPRMSYHIKGSIVIPHCGITLETPTCKFPVEHIVVGPNVHQKLALRGIESIAFPAHVTVGQSSTPLRSF